MKFSGLMSTSFYHVIGKQKSLSCERDWQNSHVLNHSGLNKLVSFARYKMFSQSSSHTNKSEASSDYQFVIVYMLIKMMLSKILV